MCGIELLIRVSGFMLSGVLVPTRPVRSAASGDIISEASNTSENEMLAFKAFGNGHDTNHGADSEK